MGLRRSLLPRRAFKRWGNSKARKNMSTSAASSSASAAPPDEELKMCPRCPEGEQYKPWKEFSIDRTRRDEKKPYCKESRSREFREYQAERKRATEDMAGENDEDDDGEPAEPAESEAAGMVDDLYLMVNSRIGGKSK